MIAKASLESFVYDLTETFFFPNKQKNKGNLQKIYGRKNFPYLILTDTDSICVFFTFICKPGSYMPVSQFRDVLFEVIVNNDVLHGFDTLDKFWENYSVRNESLRKNLVIFQSKILTTPKEYFEEFETHAVNKKHKRLGKGAASMEFEDYAKRINSIKEIETFGHLPNEKQKQNRFAI